MDVKPYLQQDMYDIGNGNSRSCSFDFSKISIDDYYPFFKGLPNFIYKKVEKVNFNTKLYHIYDDNDREMSEEEQNYYLNSIKTQKRKYPHYLFKILNSTLPKSIKLSSLVIDGIRIPSTYFDDFLKAASRCRTLKTLKVEDSPLSTEQFLKILKQWTPFHFIALSFRKDQLTSDVYKNITNYLKQPTPAGKTWKLEVFCVDDNDFSSNQLSTIRKLVSNQADLPDDNLDQETPKSSKRSRRKVNEVEEQSQNRKYKSHKNNKSNLYNEENEEQTLLDEEEEEEEMAEEEEEEEEMEEEEEEEEIFEEEEEEEEAYDE